MLFKSCDLCLSSSQSSNIRPAKSEQAVPQREQKTFHLVGLSINVSSKKKSSSLLCVCRPQQNYNVVNAAFILAVNSVCQSTRRNKDKETILLSALSGKDEQKTHMGVAPS